MSRRTTTNKPEYSEDKPTFTNGGPTKEKTPRRTSPARTPTKTRSPYSLNSIRRTPSSKETLEQVLKITENLSKKEDAGDSKFPLYGDDRNKFQRSNFVEWKEDAINWCKVRNKSEEETKKFIRNKLLGVPLKYWKETEETESLKIRLKKVEEGCFGPQNEATKKKAMEQIILKDKKEILEYIRKKERALEEVGATDAQKAWELLEGTREHGKLYESLREKYSDLDDEAVRMGTKPEDYFYGAIKKRLQKRRSMGQRARNKRS